ncbi:MAG: poly(A) polymerase [Planctomycetota bacterium]
MNDPTLPAVSPPNPEAPLEIAQNAIRPDAASIVRRLTRGGHDAYLVGGCVRDMLLGIAPKDFDLATSARPRQVKRLFRYSRIIGRRFRLVHVHMGHEIYEVATFRAPPTPPADEEAGDGDDLYIERDNVFGTEKQDAFRRDFTINGLFYEPNTRKLVDHVGGLDDLRARRLRTIGDPDVRLREDPVRILRAARFAGRLDFELDPDLADAIRRHAGDLARCAPPRVLEELYRLVCGRGSSRAFSMLEEFGCLEVLLPDLLPLGSRFFDALDRLAKFTKGDRTGVPQSVLTAVLLSPPAMRVLTDEPGADSETAMFDLIRPFGRHFTISRRDLNHAAQILAAQARLARPPRSRATQRYVRREVFPIALLARKILGPLDLERVDDAEEALAAWTELGEREGPSDTGTTRRRRRRRRGGRRRGSGGGQTPGGENSGSGEGSA